MPGVGEETSIDIAKHFGTLDKVKKATVKQFDEIDGVGEIVSKSTAEWFSDKNNIKYLKKLLKNMDYLMKA